LCWLWKWASSSSALIASLHHFKMWLKKIYGVCEEYQVRGKLLGQRGASHARRGAGLNSVKAPWTISVCKWIIYIMFLVSFIFVILHALKCIRMVKTIDRARFWMVMSIMTSTWSRRLVKCKWHGHSVTAWIICQVSAQVFHWHKWCWTAGTTVLALSRTSMQPDSINITQHLPSLLKRCLIWGKVT
jgi:hypothetical protein